MEGLIIKTLIVDDDVIFQLILKKILSSYGECNIAINGKEAIQAFSLAWQENKPYNLICMDIMMPELDGHQSLRQIRKIEELLEVDECQKVKVIMITALCNPKNIKKAYYNGDVSSYLTKPIKKQKLIKNLQNMGLIKELSEV